MKKKSITSLCCLTAVSFLPVCGEVALPDNQQSFQFSLACFSTFHKVDKHTMGSSGPLASHFSANILIFRVKHENVNYFREILRLTAFLCKDDKLYILALKSR